MTISRSRSLSKSASNKSNNIRYSANTIRKSKTSVEIGSSKLNEAIINIQKLIRSSGKKKEKKIFDLCDNPLLLTIPIPNNNIDLLEWVIINYHKYIPALINQIPPDSKKCYLHDIVSRNYEIEYIKCALKEIPVDMVNSAGNTAFFYVRSPEAIFILTSAKINTDITITNKKGENWLHYKLQTSSPGNFIQLVKHINFPKESYLHRDNKGYLPLEWAIKTGDNNVISWMLNNTPITITDNSPLETKNWFQSIFTNDFSIDIITIILVLIIKNIEGGESVVYSMTKFLCEKVNRVTSLNMMSLIHEKILTSWSQDNMLKMYSYKHFKTGDTIMHLLAHYNQNFLIDWILDVVQDLVLTNNNNGIYPHECLQKNNTYDKMNMRKGESNIKKVNSLPIKLSNGVKVMYTINNDLIDTESDIESSSEEIKSNRNAEIMNDLIVFDSQPISNNPFENNYLRKSNQETQFEIPNTETSLFQELNAFY